MNTNLSGIALAVSAALSSPVWAQPATTTPAPAGTPRVLVSASYPSAITPAASASADVASMLQDVPGIGLASGGGVSGLPSLRGLGDDRLRIQVDGMDLISACANHMNPALSYLAPSQIDAIDVLPGVTPVSAGGDSIGGTIRVRSAAPRFAAGATPLRDGRLGLLYRSNGRLRAIDAVASAATERFAIAYQGEAAWADNYRAGGDFKPAGMPTGTAHTLAANEVGSSAYTRRNDLLTLALRNGTQLLDLKLGRQRLPEQGFPNQRMDMTRNDSTQANLGYLDRFGWGTVEARLYHEQTRHAMNFGPDKQYWYGPKGDVPGMPMETEGRNSGLSLKASTPLDDNGALRLGLEAQRYRLNDWWPPSGGGMAPNTFWNIRDGQRDRLAGFLEWERRWSPVWFSQLGVRGERVASDAGAVAGYNSGYDKDAAAFNSRDRARRDHNLDLAAQARAVFSPTATYRIGYARKTRSPNLYERYSWSTGGMAMNMVNTVGDGNGYVGDIGLRPEVAHTLSASADWHDAAQQAWSLTLSPFLTYVDDYIDARCLSTCKPNSFVYLRYANTDARLYGAELAGTAQLAAGAYGQLSVAGQVNYLRGQNRGSHDGLFNLMPLNGRLTLTHRLGQWKNVLEWQLVDAKAHRSQVRNELRTGGYGLLTLRTGTTWQRVQVETGVENLLDRRYDLPLGGAYVGQGRTMGQAGTPYGIAVPGMGRALYVRVSLSL